MVIFNRYKIVTAGFEKASKKLIHTGLREIGSFTSLSATKGVNLAVMRFTPFFYPQKSRVENKMRLTEGVSLQTVIKPIPLFL